MNKNVLTVILLFLLCGAGFSQTIDKITIDGNKKISLETIRFYIKSHEGEPFSHEKVREDFKSLWETGFFEDVRIEDEDLPGGNKIVHFHLKENLLIANVSYNIKKKFSQQDINDKLQENSLSIMPMSYYNPAKVKNIERIINNMMIEKGYTDGKVSVEEKVSNGQVNLIVNVDPGMKTKIGEIVFPKLDGHKISLGFLRRGFKNNQQHGLISSILGKDTYNRDKIDEDLEEVRLRLQQNGFLEAKVGTPTFAPYRRLSFWGKPQTMLRMSVPIELGPQYKLGTVTITGNKVINSAFLKLYVKMKQGSIFNKKKVKDTIEKLVEFYGNIGYLNAYINPTENLDPEKRIADLTITVTEGDVISLKRLDFVGNTFTKDHVIRREWFLHEGMRVTRSALMDSVRRMKQLGVVTMEKNPSIEFDPEDRTKINIVAELKELNRQMISFNIGYSGYDGFFIAAGYSTQNFLGMGESLSLNLQQGTMSRNYQLGFTEPYLFNLPANAGFSVFSTRYQYPTMYTLDEKGFNLSASMRFWMFWGASLTYTYKDVLVTDMDPTYALSMDPAYMAFYLTSRLVSSLNPVIYFSTVDSPLFPTNGHKALFSYTYEGGFLGGAVNLHKFKLELVKFIPLWKGYSQILGLHFDYEWNSPFGDTPKTPFYERFYLGGDRSVRGFEVYRLGPHDMSGSIIGGDRQIYANIEYSFRLTEQFAINFFYDIGNAYTNDEPITLKNIYSSMGVELKVFIPMMNVPFRLIFAYNPRLSTQSESNWAFRFAVGPSFY